MSLNKNDYIIIYDYTEHYILTLEAIYSFCCKPNELLKNITKEFMDVQSEPVNIINHWLKSVFSSQ